MAWFRTMSEYDKYVFFLCLIVFVALTALFSALLAYIVKCVIKLIRNGVEDDILRAEYEKNKDKPAGVGLLSRLLSGVLCLAMLGVFAFSIYLKLTESEFSQSASVWIVKSPSMSFKHEENSYLFRNNLNDQLNTFDLVVTRPLPAENELQVYDIVVYEVNNELVIHRIVAIEEPNDKHPGKRYFLLQGDAVDKPDRFPVYYSQMKAIYEGERIPFLGSFISFMQSPSGYICILLILFALIATPIVEKKVNTEKECRLSQIMSVKPRKRRRPLLFRFFLIFKTKSGYEMQMEAERKRAPKITVSKKGKRLL